MKKKYLLFIGVLVFISLIFINGVKAEAIAEAGDKVVQKGSYDNTRFVAGNSIINKASIDGLSFIAGRDIKLEGSSTYDFIAGNDINIKENISKDIFVAGNNIVIDRDAIIGRDAYIAGNDIKVNSNITGTLRAGANTIDIRGITINKDAYIFADKIIMDKNTNISGKFTYSEDTNIKGLKEAKFGSVKVIKDDKIVKENDTKDSIINFIASIISSFIVMVVLFYLLPNTSDRLNNVSIEFSDIIKTSLIGLCILIIVPIISVILLFTKLLSPLALITILIYGISIYLSSLLVSYIIGNYIDDKYKNNDNKYISLLIGIVIVKIIKLIPVIGGLFSFIILLYGMGLIFSYIKNNIK